MLPAPTNWIALGCRGVEVRSRLAPGVRPGGEHGGHRTVRAVGVPRARRYLRLAVITQSPNDLGSGTDEASMHRREASPSDDAPRLIATVGRHNPPGPL
jgi:hypothetical protein